MAKQYYYFIAGLPAISMDDSKLAYSPEQFREQARAQLSEGDYRLIELLHLPSELANLLKVLYKKATDFGPEALYDHAFWQEFLDHHKHLISNPSVPEPPEYSAFPSFVGDMVIDLLKEEDLPPYPTAEHRLLQALFAFYAEHTNRFIREWFNLERNIKNILVALNGRNHKLDYAKYLIGEDDTVKNLAHSHAADFGLGKEHPLFDNVLRIYDQNNILYRERGYDILRNKWIDEENFFDYFNIDRLLGYYSKLRIIHRWLRADADLGKEVFHDTLNKLENSFEFPEDFNIKIKQK